MDKTQAGIRRIATSLIVTGVTLLGPGAALAQGKYPADHAIRLIVPFPPGGQTDIVSRKLAAKASPIVGQQIVVDNRSGAAGTIGSGECARAKPAGVPSNVVESLNATMRNVMADPSFLDVLVNAGVDPVADAGPEKATAMIKAEIAKWAPFIESLGLKQ